MEFGNVEDEGLTRRDCSKEEERSIDGRGGCITAAMVLGIESA